MTLSRDVRRQQRTWADARHIAVDQNGYVRDEATNFFSPLSDKFLKALEGAGGGELQDQRGRPAKIRALHSSAALAINVFQCWAHRSGSDFPKALGLDGTLEGIEIERQFDSGLRGMPPTMDVVLLLSDNRLVAIESKFTEWMTKKRPKLVDFGEKYLKPGQRLWATAGLPKCQALAEDIAAGRVEFRQLDALQLLKHALGLAKSAPRAFSLIYLYYDDDGRSAIGDVHRTEISCFDSAVGKPLGFRSLTYQALFKALVGVDGIEFAYLDYLRSRYFPE